MKKMVIVAAASAGALVALRRFGPAVGQRAMSKCHEMFERAAEEATPKRDAVVYCGR